MTSRLDRLRPRLDGDGCPFGQANELKRQIRRSGRNAEPSATAEAGVAEVLRSLRRRSLAKLRREVEPVPAVALARTVC